MVQIFAKEYTSWRTCPMETPGKRTTMHIQTTYFPRYIHGKRNSCIYQKKQGGVFKKKVYFLYMQHSNLYILILRKSVIISNGE
ncbi:hypothetical protein CALK_0966 [Chitinivibrio alkaliphilus ACht1]|uniref:Uncharacterized protein n=1 Tax=Chitinivibrio alkaliphilus ACht1 TaxID=1313304 RepID=U7DA44_9BACT|nr:hypothetical protein CALK_0966 [Chitinivibrio alkaliphilus ACht1]